MYWIGCVTVKKTEVVSMSASRAPASLDSSIMGESEASKDTENRSSCIECSWILDKNSAESSPPYYHDEAE